jgi:hypothetical protein
MTIGELFDVTEKCFGAAMYYYCGLSGRRDEAAQTSTKQCSQQLRDLQSRLNKIKWIAKRDGNVEIVQLLEQDLAATSSPQPPAVGTEAPPAAPPEESLSERELGRLQMLRVVATITPDPPPDWEK